MNTAVDFSLQLLPRPMPVAMSDALRTRFGQRFVTSLAVREQHGRDESPFDAPPPEAVVFCESTEEVSFVVATACEHRVPVIPYGAGSSLEGHLLAVQGGVSVDVSRMDRVLRLDADDLTVTVQAGVTRLQLNREIRDWGLFFPIDPGADATLGGMAATRASGTNAVRYGTMRDNVLALTVVTASGEVIRTGTRARKSSAGYDLTRLMVGSEGTLGVITEVTLKLHPLPESVAAAICSFDDATSAVDTVIAIIQMGVPIARCELMDANAVIAVNRHDRLGLAEAEAAGIPHFIVGHVGDGNFHVAYLVDPDAPQERATAERLNHQLVQRAIAAGGTCTGEHGIGLHKQGFLVDEAGTGAVAMMRQIKRALDPHDIMNPGKIFSL